MARRRASGEGMLRKREDGRWEGRIIIGHKNNGSPIFKWVYGDTQKATLRKLHQIIEGYRDVELTEDSRMTVEEWLEKWLDEYMPGTIRENTLESYRKYVENYIAPYIGEKQMMQVTMKDIQQLYNKLSAEGRIREHPDMGYALSNSMVHRIHTMMHKAMRNAVEARIIARNPTEGTILPKVERVPMQVLDEEQLERFMEEIEGDEVWHDLFYVEITTGLRRGEICGLMWSDFDAKKGTLKIRRTVHVEAKGRIRIGDTKTTTGNRTILLPPSTAELLRNREKDSVTQWIFPNPTRLEMPVSPSSAYNRLKVVLKNAELPSVRFHDLRHTFATHALSSGVDAKTLSGILGHTNASFTLDTYAHVTGDMHKRAAEIVGGFMEDILGTELKPWQREENAEKEALD